MQTAFELIGKDWRDFVISDDNLMRPTDILKNKVNPSKAARELNWIARNGMKNVIRMMLDAEFEDLGRERSPASTGEWSRP